MSMLQDLSSLRTFDIGSEINGSYKLSGELGGSEEFENPTVSTLILNLETVELERWSFPNLHTFSIHIRNTRSCSLIWMKQAEMSIKDFIRRHRKGLRSLRVIFPLGFFPLTTTGESTFDDVNAILHLPLLGISNCDRNSDCESESGSNHDHDRNVSTNRAS